MSLSRQLWRTVEDYQVLGSPAAHLISAQRKESPVRLGWVGGCWGFKGCTYLPNGNSGGKSQIFHSKE